MSVPIFNVASSLVANVENDFGETPLKYSPCVSVVGGGSVVPQQYLDVRRTLENLENVLAEISVPDSFQLFAGLDRHTLFIEVGIIGEENYPTNPKVIEQPKMVYGRRWMIEPTTPTSEVVQTALLAVKKAREHELREKFKLKNSQGNGVATPFNCHQDLPLMANQRFLFEGSKSAGLTEADLGQLLRSTSIGGLGFRLESCLQLAGNHVFEVALFPVKHEGSEQVDKKIDFPEMHSGKLVVVCEEQTEAHFLHQLFNACLARSDRYVEENFSFQGFHRFSQTISPIAIARFSRVTRKLKSHDARFDKEFQDMSYRVDSAKAPRFNSGKLGAQQRALLKRYPVLNGYLPKE